MQHEHGPEPADGGLSTEDLARPRARGADESRSAPESPPVYPGEAGADGETGTTPQEANATTAEAPPLLAAQEEDEFRARWREIQNQFVDDPRQAVHAADTLVAAVMQNLAATFAEHKQALEGQWNRGEQVNTEELRMALQKYRAFFNRLLTT